LSQKSQQWKPRGIRFGVYTVGLGAVYLVVQNRVNAEAPPSKPKYRISEIRKHGAKAEKIWVYRGTGVYDITDWIPGHPGGEVILQAAGGSIDPFWKIFSIHQKQDVYDILEQYRIGDIDPRDLVNGEVPADDVYDPFVQDPERDSRLKQHSSRPCNAETPGTLLTEQITPNELFYVRNHLWVPQDGPDTHKILVELPDGTDREYTMAELKSKFREHTITATLQCSGNRRSHMTQRSRSTNGLQWDVGAIGNATWTGVYLRDVLQDVGLSITELPKDAKHVQFTGTEAYGASIPIAKAVDPQGDVLLAYKMNGVDLPPDHGYPLRVLVPGTVAARSVKWVSKIIVSEEESTSQWQRRDYKCFGPNEGSKPDWSRAPSIQETPVQSAITSFREISAHSVDDRKALQVYGLEEDSIALTGYAFAGGGREIVRVDVSYDGGHTWRQAVLEEADTLGSKNWSWKRWSHVVPKREVGLEVVVKAVDEGYNTQPDTHGPTYNFRGNLATAWHRLSYEPK